MQKNISFLLLNFKTEWENVNIFAFFAHLGSIWIPISWYLQFWLFNIFWSTSKFKGKFGFLFRKKIVVNEMTDAKTVWEMIVWVKKN